MTSATDTARAPAPFVVGVSRSGTTLQRLMLDAHPHLAIPAETRFLPELIDLVESGGGPAAAAAMVTRHERWNDFGLSAELLRGRMEDVRPFNAGQAARAFFELYAEGQGKPRWGDKSPPYVTELARLHRVLPEARFIHVIRDGRAVAASLLRREWGKRRPRAIARRWVREVRAARDAGRRLPAGAYTEVRYEELVVDPEPILRRICELVEIRFDSAMLDYHARAQRRLSELQDLQTAAGHTFARERRMTQFGLLSDPPRAERADAWRDELTDDQRRAVEAVAGELLGELGYPSA